MHVDSPILKAIKEQLNIGEVEALRDCLVDTDELGVYCLDLSKNTNYPLWLVSYLEAVFKALVSYPKLVVIVSGVRQTVRPEGKRWTKKAQGEYAGLIGYLEDFAGARSGEGQVVELLFV